MYANVIFNNNGSQKNNETLKMIYVLFSENKSELNVPPYLSGAIATRVSKIKWVPLNATTVNKQLYGNVNTVYPHYQSAFTISFIRLLRYVPDHYALCNLRNNGDSC